MAAAGNLSAWGNGKERDMESNEFDGFFWFMLLVGIVGVLGFMFVAGAGL